MIKNLLRFIAIPFKYLSGLFFVIYFTLDSPENTEKDINNNV
jgi:hypothetical protein